MRSLDRTYLVRGPPALRHRVGGVGDGVGDYDALLVLSFGGSGGARRRDAVPGERRARPRRPARAADGGRRALPGLRRGQPDQPAEPRARSRRCGRWRGVPVYWGNRNWHPFGEDTVRRMAADGVRKAAVFATSAYAGYSSCRQYYEDIARISVDGGPELVKLRHYCDHPGFVEAMADHTRQALARLGRDDARAGVHRAQHPGLDGRDGRPLGRSVRGAAAPDRRAGQPVAGPYRAVGPGVAVAQRPASGAVAGARRLRPPARPPTPSPWCWCRSGSSPTTWRSSTTSTPRPGRWPTSWGCPWSGRRPRAPTRPSSGWCASCMDEPEPVACALTCCPPPRRRPAQAPSGPQAPQA